jgi:FkbM family methyltransferase
MHFLARLMTMISHFVTVAAKWGVSAAWNVIVASRGAGVRYFALDFPRMRFTYRGRIDRPVLSYFFVDFGYLDTNGSAPIRTIVDAGANIGCFSVVAKRLWPEANIAALEIDQGNFAILEKNARQLAGVTPVRAALWSRDGDVEFVVGESSQSHWVRTAESDGATTVACTSLSSLMAEFGFETIDILKMDIEGAEAEVLKSLDTATLARINAIIFECNDAENQSAAMQVFQALPASEFGAYSFGENIFLVRRTTGWEFRRHYGTSPYLPFHGSQR